MIQNVDFYNILGVSRSASNAEIKRAYRALAVKYHPDSSQSEDGRRFQEVTEAYTVLGDAKKRRRYDVQMDGLRRPPFSSTSAGYQFTPPPTFKSKSPFGSIAKGKGAITVIKETLSAFTNKKTKNVNAKPYANDLRGERSFQFTIDTVEARLGTNRELAIGRPERPQRILVKIPPGTVDGCLLRIKSPSVFGNRESIITVKVNVVKHSIIDIQGSDLTLTLPITISEALIGTEVQIPVGYTTLNVKIPPMEVSSPRLRLKGHGLLDKTTGSRGDLYVKTSLVLPDSETPGVREAAEALEKFYGDSVRKDALATLSKLVP